MMNTLIIMIIPSEENKLELFFFRFVVVDYPLFVLGHVNLFCILFFEVTFEKKVTDKYLFFLDLAHCHTRKKVKCSHIRILFKLCISKESEVLTTFSSGINHKDLNYMNSI